MTWSSDKDAGSDGSPVTPNEGENDKSATAPRNAQVLSFPARPEIANLAPPAPQASPSECVDPSPSQKETPGQPAVATPPADATSNSPSPETARATPEARIDARVPVQGTVAANGNAPALAHGGGGSGPNGGSGGGGGGGGGGSTPLHRRSSEREFRDVLGKGLGNARRNLVTVGIFSIAVNILVLSIPIYLLRSARMC
jgi:ATP-binding cassette subfamily C protein